MILSRLCNMASPAKVVLLACGSFNPITNMHLRMFEVARDHLHKTGRFHVIGGIISPVNDGYAKKGLLSCKHRVAMSRLAAESSTWLTVDPWESEQDTWLETAKVLRHHQAVLDARYISDSVNGNRSKRPELQSSVSHITSIAKRTRRSRSIQQQQQNLDLIESNSNFTTTALSPFNFCTSPVLDGQKVSRSKRRKLHLDVDGTQNNQECASGSDNRVGRTPDDGYFSQINSPEYERPVQLMLLCGADMLESFAVPGLWKEEDIDEIVGKFGIVVINRAGSDPRKFIYDSDALTRLENHIEIVTEWIPNEISSTRVRRALKRRNSVKYLIPDPVIDYIHLHKLYLQEEEKQ
ncbi:nicotinamide/nicotinic acid mononucleotide adenylyltransferase 1-like isoform X2 [Ptychodera flava]|uniref:nicotinamide/nicotinic acid mononucleotide adenylyltransferase 1-like isoform X2 n=1 Tax=Ptychodera flava TaxID=63121 RepID=UPI00396A5921